MNAAECDVEGGGHKRSLRLLARSLISLVVVAPDSVVADSGQKSRESVRPGNDNNMGPERGLTIARTCCLGVA